jgi:hypothetical protein
MKKLYLLIVMVTFIASQSYATTFFGTSDVDVRADIGLTCYLDNANNQTGNNSAVEIHTSMFGVKNETAVDSETIDVTHTGAVTVAIANFSAPADTRLTASLGISSSDSTDYNSQSQEFSGTGSYEELNLNYKTQIGELLPDGENQQNLNATAALTCSAAQ